MATISMRIEDQLLAEINRQAKQLKLSRSEYLRRALAEMSARVASDLRRQRIQEASQKVRRESMRINREFASFEEAPDA